MHLVSWIIDGLLRSLYLLKGLFLYLNSFIHSINLIYFRPLSSQLTKSNNLLIQYNGLPVQQHAWKSRQQWATNEEQNKRRRRRRSDRRQRCSVVSGPTSTVKGIFNMKWHSLNILLMVFILQCKQCRLRRRWRRNDWKLQQCEPGIQPRWRSFKPPAVLRSQRHERPQQRRQWKSSSHRFL